MRLLLAFVVLFALPTLAAIKLYLKDGSYQIVREYEVRPDRVRYYTVERSSWEEIPLDLIDLNRTRAEQAEADAQRRQAAEALAAEDQAERAAAREIARVPYNPGVYWVNRDELVAIKQAESKVVTNKKRSILKAITPIPILAGKATLELDGETSANVIPNARPEFYLRLSAEERFGIARLTRQKDSRIVEKWSIVPVSKELFQEHDAVEIFRHQVGDSLYKIWPQQPLEPGEYAVIQYTEGKGNTQIWDFSYRPAGKP